MMTIEHVRNSSIGFSDAPEGRRYLSSPDSTKAHLRSTGGDDRGLNPVAVAILAMAFWAAIGFAWYALT